MHQDLPGEVEIDTGLEFPVNPQIKGALKSLAGVATALEQDSVLAGGRGQSQLVQGQDLAAVLKDALAGLLGHVESGDLEETNKH